MSNFLFSKAENARVDTRAVAEDLGMAWDEYETIMWGKVLDLTDLMEESGGFRVV
jgi:hypothetical protein